MFVNFFYRNISTWGLVLKSLLQGTRWCNQILIRILGLWDMTFFISKSMRFVLMSAISAFSACQLLHLLSGPRIQLKWAQISEESGRKKCFLEGRGVDVDLLPPGLAARHPPGVGIFFCWLMRHAESRVSMIITFRACLVTFC
jgi:hypothetical protein